MKETRLTIPELSLIAGTRVALGGGLALLLADRLSREQRKAAGWALFLVGAITTIPLGIIVICKRR
jgi:4-amino-4-deoxy-L-arabinose transferase-like glycosyltransferase